MNIQIGDWRDNSGGMREQIVRDVIDIMFRYFHNDALFKNDLQIIDIHTANCPWADENPCTHFDRSRICLNVQGAFWCQFVHQVSHELCHCSTSRQQLPQKIKWFDEFICCCSSYLVETIIAQETTQKYEYMFFGRTKESFLDYLKIESEGHIYRVDNIQEFFADNKEQYLKNENLIKKHDVYVRTFFETLIGDFSGLSFVGKMYLVRTDDEMVVEDFLQQLLKLCDTKEQSIIYQICKLFGIKLVRQMKNSGISWVGEIPQHWKIRRTKYCFASTKEIAGIRADDYERLALTMNGVIKRSKDDNTGLQPEKFETYQILRPNELVFKLIDLQNISTSRVGLSPYLGLVSPAYIILKSSNGKVLPRFAEKYFLMLWKNQIFNALGDAGVRSSLNIADLLEIPIAFPSIAEQQRIADFLDKECEKIDGLKADIQAQIDTLEQFKRSVITEVVSHGLNASAPMKDSDIAWVGNYPSHWTKKRGKYILNLLSKSVRENDGVITCFRDGEVTLRSNRREEGFTMADKEIGYQGIDIGDLVVHGMDGFAGAIGISDSRGKASPVLNVLDTEQNKKYIMYYLRSMAYNDVFTALSTGIRVRSCDLRWNKLAELLYPLPPIDEQQTIVEYIDEQIAKTNLIIANKKAQLETLDDYKKSLIYEYVTGKKEVE